MNRLAARLLRVTAMTVMTAALPGALLAASNARAAIADGELGLSNDGVIWGRTLAHPLFDSAFRWVPGDTETRSFFVRNQSGQAGDLVIDVQGSRANALMQTGDLSVSARGVDGAWQAISEPGRHRLLSEVQVPSGDRKRVQVTVAFGPASTNQSQIKALDLKFQVRLTEHIDSEGRPRPGNGLPDTGASPCGGRVALGIGLVGCGVLLLRRREASNAQPST